MPRNELQPIAAYENAHLVARDLLADIVSQLDQAMSPDDTNLRWQHVHTMNRLNAALSQSAQLVDELNNRNR